MKIFISYSSKSRNQVTALATDLELLGHEVWFDRELEGGQVWWDTIMAALRDCELFIFALTNHALKSRPCELEYTYAYELKKPILPVLMADDVTISLLPPVLQERQFVNYVRQDKAALIAVNSAIRSIPAAPPLPQPLPAQPPVPISPLGSLRQEIDQVELSYEQQLTILHRLKGFLDDPDLAADARQLLQLFSEHPTLLAAVYRDVEDLLSRQPAPAQPEAAPGPDAPDVATNTEYEAFEAQDRVGDSIQPASPNHGVITIHRRRAFFYMVIGFGVDMDGSRIGAIRNNGVIHYDSVPAGQHQLLIRSYDRPNLGTYPFTIQPGEHLYFLLSVKTNMISARVEVDQVDRETYIQALSEG